LEKPFNEKQKQLFIKEYLKYRKEKDLEEQINYFIPILCLSIFLWAIEHTLKVKNKEFHKEFLKKNDIRKDIAYVKTMFKRNLRAGVIDQKYNDLDLDKIILK